MKFTTYYMGMDGNSKDGVFMAPFKGWDGDTSDQDDLDHLAKWIDNGDHYWAECDGNKIATLGDIQRFID